MPNNDLLDYYDRLILRELDRDSRKAFSQIASDLGISNTMVHQRVTRLRQIGVLEKMSIVLDEKKLGYEWSAFTGLVLREDSDSGQIIEALKKIPEVTECYYVTGTYTLYIRIVAKSSDHLRKLLYEKIDHIKGVQKTESQMDLGCAFRRNLPLKDDEASYNRD
ncbi:MAG: Lrp/AsnC ligand binding domain-containing protein [Haliscomenobacter sp.]|nr:Lrp/AsnC ligand binding domain-containing protein [Haliscomenobacter sp.]MBK7475097.1 Lrp/AsnC ligand binding domain-containing protein [Haliscomenobacter sp.]MBK8879905.1 Lrp/AsnC ligand binding domain-containing protein [Haliscomenobacter sp.]